jgi:hypothetical protein
MPIGKMKKWQFVRHFEELPVVVSQIVAASFD